MNLISIENLSKAYNEKQLFNNINYGIAEGEKIGLIGINGTGKTTLLRIIASIEKPDTGEVIIGNNVNIEYLPQNIEFDPEATVLEQVFNGNSKNIQLVRRYQEALLNSNTKSDIIVKLSQEMDEADAWKLESEAKSILTQLEIFDFHEKIKNLSGGERKRVALASSLINPADLLILDEPTNHLDNITIDWLEEYLKSRKGALLMITHDRYFLDLVVEQIIELSKGSLYSYKGNYNHYLEKKLDREEMDFASERKRQSLLRKELAWMKQGAKARSTKQKARIERYYDLNNRQIDLSNEILDISVGGSRLGKKIIEINNISKSYGKKNLIDNFSYIVLRDDRIGIIGPNGYGKSTLLDIISGKLKPDKGIIDIGETVKIGMFTQESLKTNSNTRAIEFIREGGEFIPTSDGAKISASQMMERFLFPKEEQYTPINKLSGGEKRRLQLLRVLMSGPNVLLLDEPTNDLDIDTLTVLEDYIEEFPGPVIIVSHDRYLLDKLVDKLFVFEGDGSIVQYTGNYAYFKEEVKKMDRKAPKHEKLERNKETNKPLRFSYKEQREWDEIDSVIEKIEKDILAIDKKVEDFTSDYTKLEKLLEERKLIEIKLEEKMERWLYLNELAEKIDKIN